MADDGSKAALLDGMVGRLLRNLLPASGLAVTADWRQRLRVLAYAARDLAHRHPWAAALLFARRSVTPDAVRAVDQIYAALLDAGVPESQVPRLERLVSTLVLGYAASEVGGRFGAGPVNRAARRDQLPAGALPGHARLARWLDAPVDWAAEFEADLQDLERPIELAAARPR